ncbi:CREB-regulated transcription coactivator 3-like isoform X2 [Limulus polyphemus]|uniref:CREB-regulated transcription coactivator 3-like isoform X2 n=1 Tax=Limulus polyphemus TaxID=6850 RepID=A0ABM1TB25_LIMPO|nr:CREB-regulated transcription coactivator 3-like isoform X2 [Limulus polyphemus]
MANPRKFSEKIALHNQKQAEETAAFEQVMREVLGAKRVVYQKQQLLINQSLGSYRGGSLPNVNQISNSSGDAEQQGAIVRMDDVKQGCDLLSDRMEVDRIRQFSLHGLRQIGIDKQMNDFVLTSGGQTYLSLPSDTNWRRTNSDSALHQTTSLSQKKGLSNEKDSTQTSSNVWDPRKQPENNILPSLSQSLPKSGEVPSIDVYPLDDESSLMHIAMSNNTGSLPDLTNLQFPSPLATPIDIEDHTGALVSSSYSPRNSPQAISGNFPSSLSPQQQHVHIIGPEINEVGLTLPSSSGERGGSRHSSPGPSPSPSSRHRHHHNQNMLVIGSGSSRSRGHQHGSHTLKQQGMSKETKGLSLNTYTQQTKLGVYPEQQAYPTSCDSYGNRSGTLSQVSIGLYHSNGPLDHSCSAPTSPVAHSVSPVDSCELGSNLSLSKSPFTDTDYYFQQHQQPATTLQQQQEQVKMLNETAEQKDQISILADNISSGNSPMSQTTSGIGYVDVVRLFDKKAELVEGTKLLYPDVFAQGLLGDQETLEMAIQFYGMVSSGSEAYIQSPPFLSSSNVLPSNHPTTPKTPQTPTSIPDIVLTVCVS